MKYRILAIVGAALLAGALGLIVSIRFNGPGPLLGTPAGRWLTERVAPSQVPSDIHPASEGELIGSLPLTDLDGNPRQLPATRGHRVLVNVWASWCGPCRDEMPVLVGFAKAQGANGTIVVGIAQDDPSPVRAYLLRTPVNYPILLDQTQGRAGVQLGNRLGALPYSVLIDVDGRLLRRQYGPFASANALAAWVSAP
jgi:thiol-disulfide isomerase/thioredoxin